MGRQWIDRYTWPERGVQVGNHHWNHHWEEEERPERVKWVTVDPMPVLVVFWKQLRTGRTGPQELSFILLFLCKHGVRV